MTYGTAIQIPEAPINEEWAWLTDLSTSFDGTEDRIALLRYPRRTFSGNYRFDDKDALRRHLAMMTKRFKGEFAFPLFQYQTKLKAKALAGDTVVFVNARRSNFRVGGAAFIMDGDTFEEVEVAVVTEASVEFAEPLTNAYSSRAFVCPLATVFTNTNANITRQNPDHSATSSFSYIERLPTIPFVTPLSEAVVETFDGMPVLPFHAVGSSFDGTISTGLQAMEYTGLIDLISPWKVEQWAHNLSFKVNHIRSRFGNLAERFPELVQGDDVSYPPVGTNYPKKVRVGPFQHNTKLIAGSPNCRPDDFLILNGIQYGVEDNETYAAGTEFFYLFAGRTLQIEVKNVNNPYCGIYGSLTLEEVPNLEWWQVFAEAIQGSANPFLFPTNRSDLEVVTPAIAGGSALTVKGDLYTQHYWGHDAFERIFIDTTAGRHYAKVTAISAVLGNDRLTFDPPLPTDPDWATEQKVGFLLKLRNDNDKISCKHSGLWTEVSMAVRTVD
jgi:hypothetical protein